MSICHSGLNGKIICKPVSIDINFIIACFIKLANTLPMMRSSEYYNVRLAVHN